LVDRPPPSRYSVVERGGRLVVIDKDTGQTPPSAAERMAAYDRRMGHEPVQPAARSLPQDISAPVAEPLELAVVAPARPANDRMAAAVAAMNRKQPWKEAARRPGATDSPARLAPQSQPQRQAGGRKTIVTAKWWDAKGPRTIELGPKGQQTLSGGFMTMVFVALIAATVTLFIAPILLFAAAFLIFRFGGKILGPIGAGIIDKAIAERN
jgi:hypothetical protein